MSLRMGREATDDPIGDRDMVRFDRMESPLPISNISSGLQSLISMLAYVSYLTHNVYELRSDSVARTQDNYAYRHRLYQELTKDWMSKHGSITKSYQLKVNDEILTFPSEELRDKFSKRYNNYTRYQHSDIYLEEPEENLFPKAQADVVYKLLDEIFMSGMTTLCSWQPTVHISYMQ